MILDNSPAFAALLFVRLALSALGISVLYGGFRAYRRRRVAPDTPERRRRDRPWKLPFSGVGLFLGSMGLMVARHQWQWPTWLHLVARTGAYAGAAIALCAALWVGWSNADSQGAV